MALRRTPSIARTVTVRMTGDPERSAVATGLSVAPITRPASAFPCIGEGTLSLAESMRGALVELLGARAAAAVVKQVRAFRA